MYMGSNYEKSEVVFDTGSSWLTIALKPDCHSCTHPSYDPSQSTSANLITSDPKYLGVSSVLNL